MGSLSRTRLSDFTYIYVHTLLLPLLLSRFTLSELLKLSHFPVSSDT